MIGFILVLSWTTYRLLISKDFTLLQTSMFQNPSLKMPDFEHLSEEQISKYQRTAYRVGWWILAVTVIFIILLVYLNIWAQKNCIKKVPKQNLLRNFLYFMKDHLNLVFVVVVFIQTFTWCLAK